MFYNYGNHRRFSAPRHPRRQGHRRAGFFPKHANRPNSRSFSAVFGSLLLLHEFIYASGGVNEFLLLRIKRMAGRTDFDMNIGQSRIPDRILCSTVTDDRRRMCLWMNTCFHACAKNKLGHLPIQCVGWQEILTFAAKKVHTHS